MSENTACDAVRKILLFAADHLLNNLVKGLSVQEQLSTRAMYEDVQNFPGVVGTLDWTHIQIRKHQNMVLIIITVKSTTELSCKDV